MQAQELPGGSTALANGFEERLCDRVGNDCEKASGRAEEGRQLENAWWSCATLQSMNLIDGSLAIHETNVEVGYVMDERTVQAKAEDI
jgi:hypothetical protein